MKRLVLVAGAVLALGAPEAEAQTSDCGLGATPGTVTRTVDGRAYRLNVPAGLEAPAPLLVSLHGFGGNPQAQETFTGWTQTAAEKKFIVAYPSGRGSQYGGAWDPYTASSPDVAHIRAVVADISGVYCVDPASVYADGWSNGAVMSQRLACAAADLFAKVQLVRRRHADRGRLRHGLLAEPSDLRRPVRGPVRLHLRRAGAERKRVADAERLRGRPDAHDGRLRDDGHLQLRGGDERRVPRGGQHVAQLAVRRAGRRPAQPPLGLLQRLISANCTGTPRSSRPSASR